MSLAANDVLQLFPLSYAASRHRFRQSLAGVQDYWPEARLVSHRVEGPEDLTIDWIEASARRTTGRILIFTTGQHGIEGYVGSAMLQMFLQEYLPRLDPANTGLLLVHAINPWGMKHYRRVNAANVDLNRNFYDQPPLGCNPDYDSLRFLLAPARPVNSRWSFIWRLGIAMLRFGAGRLRQSTLMGQYQDPGGIYFGGTERQEETSVLMDLVLRSIALYNQVLHLDMHTGYGPRYQMSMVNSSLEPRSSSAISQATGYPLVVKATAGEFYDIQGDMVDWLYAYVQEHFPTRHLYVTSFEFGTLGDSLAAGIRSLRASMLENQVWHYGTRGDALRQWIAREFLELFAPEELAWRRKAVADARQALDGILRAEFGIL